MAATNLDPGDLRIGRAFRFALLGKGILLAGMGLVFAAVAMTALRAAWPWPVRLVAAMLAIGLALFLLWASALALLDALFARAQKVRGAVALESRAAGHSLRMPNGTYAEFILWNPWQPLTPGAQYTIVIGRFSRVLVSRPELKPP